jgi:hypothetical protein
LSKAKIINRIRLPINPIYFLKSFTSFLRIDNSPKINPKIIEKWYTSVKQFVSIKNEIMIRMTEYIKILKDQFLYNTDSIFGYKNLKQFNIALSH